MGSRHNVRASLGCKNLIKTMSYRNLFMLSAAFILLTACSSFKRTGANYDSYQGLVMAGYQGWFNAEGDGANRGFYHYVGKDGFKPGSATIDMWPDVSEYDKTYPTSFTMPDGSAARVFSSEDSTTVDTHFRWMKEYGLDGVFMQRFITEIKGKSGLRHFDTVLSHAMVSANTHNRAIAVMYDLSGMDKEDYKLLLSDIKEIASKYNLFDRKKNPSYLYHNGRPLVSVWGIGFNDGRNYGLGEADSIIRGLRQQGFSIMLGVPTHWRTLNGDTESDSRLHSLIKKCDIVMPWFVGRYDEEQYEQYRPLIKDDIEWCNENHIDYAPLVYPGFAWRNMCGTDSFFVPRNNGSFFRKQLDGAIEMGARMIYVAMFDEIDEGTAIFKCSSTVPVPENGTEFIPIDKGLSSDHYLKTAGYAAKRLKTGKK